MSVLGEEDLIPLHGPAGPIPQEGATSVIGPGTGLGVAILLHRHGRFAVVETESAHIAFAPLDAEEAAIGEQLRRKFGRVSVERLVSGPGLGNLVSALAALEGVPDPALPDAELWTRALAGSDPLVIRALDHFLAAFGAAAGDFSLAHGAMSVIITGGLANRLGDHLRAPAFVEAFKAKGRYRERMEKIRIRLATYAEPGLFGAAVAFQRQHFD
jgi:glucokinase